MSYNYNNGDIVDANTINTIFNKMDNLGSTPNTDNVDNVGIPSVSIDPIVGNFVFANLKGSIGNTGLTGNTGTSIRFKGNYSSSETYYNNSQYYDMVYYNGSLYGLNSNIESANNILPTNTNYYSVLALKGADGTGIGNIFANDVTTLSKDKEYILKPVLPLPNEDGGTLSVQLVETTKIDALTDDFNSLNEKISPTDEDLFVLQDSASSTNPKTDKKIKYSNLKSEITNQCAKSSGSYPNLSVGKSTSDADGNNIIDTYATKDDIANMADITKINATKITGYSVYLYDTDGSSLSLDDYNVILNHKRLYNGALYEENDSSLPTPSATTPLEIIPTGNQAKIQIAGTNVIPQPYPVSSSTIDGITYTVNDDFSVTAKGTATAGLTYGSSFMLVTTAKYLQLESGKSYTLTGCPSGGASNKYYMRCDTTSYGVNGVDTGNGATFNVDNTNNKVYIFIRIYNAAGNVDLTFYPMLSVGTKVLQYQQYITPTYQDFTFIATDSLNQSLIDNAITIGDYASEVKDDKVTVYTGKKILNGTENWQIGSDTGTFNVVTYFSSYSNSNILCLANLLKGVKRTELFTDEEQYEEISCSSGVCRVRCPNGITTVEQWKTQLAEWNTAGTPLIVYYVLATPQEVEITPNEPIPTISGGTVLSTEDIDLTNAQPILDFTDYQSERIYGSLEFNGKTYIPLTYTTMVKDPTSNEYLSTILPNKLNTVGGEISGNLNVVGNLTATTQNKFDISTKVATTEFIPNTTGLGTSNISDNNTTYGNYTNSINYNFPNGLYHTTDLNSGAPDYCDFFNIQEKDGWHQGQLAFLSTNSKLKYRDRNNGGNTTVGGAGWSDWYNVTTSKRTELYRGTPSNNTTINLNDSYNNYSFLVFNVMFGDNYTIMTIPIASFNECIGTAYNGRLTIANDSSYWSTYKISNSSTSLYVSAGGRWVIIDGIG